MIKNGYAKLFYDFVEATEMLDDAEVGRLTKAIVKYARGDKESAEAELTGNERIIFPMFKLQIERDAEKAEEVSASRKAAGSLGGRPKKDENQLVNPETKEKQKNQMVFEETKKTHEKEKEKENDYEKDYDEEKENDSLEDHNHNHFSSDNVFADEQAGVIPESDWKRVADAYHYEIGGLPTGTALEMLQSYVDDLGADAVIVAIKQTGADQPDCLPWKWLKRILDRFADLHVHDAEGAKAACNDWERAKRAKRNAGSRASPPPIEEPINFSL